VFNVKTRALYRQITTRRRRRYRVYPIADHVADKGRLARLKRMSQRMHMRNLDRRVQLLLDEPRYRKLTGEAKRRRVSVAAIIREAIDQLPADADRRRAAIAEVLAAEPMALPADPAELRREIDAAHEAR
jgi:hypothetical protein